MGFIKAEKEVKTHKILLSPVPLNSKKKAILPCVFTDFCRKRQKQREKKRGCKRENGGPPLEVVDIDRTYLSTWPAHFLSQHALFLLLLPSLLLHASPPSVCLTEPLFLSFSPFPSLSRSLSLSLSLSLPPSHAPQTLSSHCAALFKLHFTFPPLKQQQPVLRFSPCSSSRAPNRVIPLYVGSESDP